MEQIYDTQYKLQTFDFSKLILSKPTLISGGNYFIRFKKDNMPIYLQPPPCNTRNGFIKNGRKYYTDLLFTNEDECIIQWFEKLEEHSIQYIYNNRESWFDGDMQKADIENFFTSPLKIYKSGKYYLVRTNIPTALEKPIIKIYDENENVVDYTTINDNTKLMNIIEVKGIKFSAHSFQIDIEMKQALIIKPQDMHIFDKCIIQTNNTPQVKSEDVPRVTPEIPIPEQTMTISTEETDNNEIINDVVENIKDTIIENSTITPNDNNINNLGNLSETDIANDINNKNTDLDINDEINSSTEETVEIMHNENEHDKSDDIHEIKIDTVNNKNDIEEIDLNLEDLSGDDKVILREPSEVYYKMYRDARQKAKLAKELALSSYLEAKNIKKTYMLTNIDDSDTSDLDIENESIMSENDSLQ